MNNIHNLSIDKDYNGENISLESTSLAHIELQGDRLYIDGKKQEVSAFEKILTIAIHPQKEKVLMFGRTAHGELLVAEYKLMDGSTTTFDATKIMEDNSISLFSGADIFYDIEGTPIVNISLHLKEEKKVKTIICYGDQTLVHENQGSDFIGLYNRQISSQYAIIRKMVNGTMKYYKVNMPQNDKETYQKVTEDTKLLTNNNTIDPQGNEKIVGGQYLYNKDRYELSLTDGNREKVSMKEFLGKNDKTDWMTMSQLEPSNIIQKERTLYLQSQLGGQYIIFSYNLDTKHHERVVESPSFIHNFSVSNNGHIFSLIYENNVPTLKINNEKKTIPLPDLSGAPYTLVVNEDGHSVTVYSEAQKVSIAIPGDYRTFVEQQENQEKDNIALGKILSYCKENNLSLEEAFTQLVHYNKLQSELSEIKDKLEHFMQKNLLLTKENNLLKTEQTDIEQKNSTLGKEFATLKDHYESLLVAIKQSNLSVSKGMLGSSIKGDIAAIEALLKKISG